jgi:plasmid stabilization system protein ParE
LAEIHHWLRDREDLEAADRVSDMLGAALRRVAAIGHPGAPRDHLLPGLRSVNHKGFNVYFVMRGTEFRVLRIVRGTRDIRKLDFTDDGN